MSVLLSAALSLSLCMPVSASWFTGLFGTTEASDEEESTTDFDPDFSWLYETSAEAVENPGGSWMQGIFPDTVPEDTETEEASSPEETSPEETSADEEPSPTEEPYPLDGPSSSVAGFTAETEPDYYNMSFNELIEAYRLLLGKYNALLAAAGGSSASAAESSTEEETETEEPETEEPETEEPETEEPLTEEESRAEVSAADVEAIEAALNSGDFFLLYDLVGSELPEDLDSELKEIALLQFDSVFDYGSDGFIRLKNAGYRVNFGIFRDNLQIGIRKISGKSFNSYTYEVMVLESGELMRLTPGSDGKTILLEGELLEKLAAENSDIDIRCFSQNGSSDTGTLSPEDAEVLAKLSDIISWVCSRYGIVR